MNKDKIYNVGLLGFGKISTNNSTNFPNYSLSHSMAISKLPNLKLAKIFEPNKEMQKNSKDFSDIIVSSENDFWKSELDMVVIASPTQFHFSQLKSALEKKIPLIVLEKPFSHDTHELEKYKELLSKNSDSKIVLNLPRHFDLTHNRLFDRIKNQEFGRALSFSSTLTKGFIHNGIHLLDLISSVLGKEFELNPIRLVKVENDILGSVVVIFSDFSGVIQCLPSTQYSLFELVCYFEKAKITITNNGRIIQIFYSEKSELYGHFNELSRLETLTETFDCAIDQVYLNLISLDKKALYSKMQYWLELNQKLVTLKDIYESKS